MPACHRRALTRTASRDRASSVSIVSDRAAGEARWMTVVARCAAGPRRRMGRTTLEQGRRSAGSARTDDQPRRGCSAPRSRLDLELGTVSQAIPSGMDPPAADRDEERDAAMPCWSPSRHGSGRGRSLGWRVRRVRPAVARDVDDRQAAVGDAGPRRREPMPRPRRCRSIGGRRSGCVDVAPGAGQPPSPARRASDAASRRRAACLAGDRRPRAPCALADRIGAAHDPRRAALHGRRERRRAALQPAPRAEHDAPARRRRPGRARRCPDVDDRARAGRSGGGRSTRLRTGSAAGPASAARSGGLVGPLPRQVEVGAAEVAVRRGLAVDRPAQVERRR